MDLPLETVDVHHILFGGYPHQGGIILEKLKRMETFPYCCKFDKEHFQI